MTCGNTPALVALAFVLGVCWHGAVWLTLDGLRDQSPLWRRSS